MPEDARPLGPVPVAAHGHQIAGGRPTPLPAEGGLAIAALEGALAESGGRPGPDAVPALAAVCAQYPDFLDGWARLGQAWYVAGQPVTAYACARVGYHRGLDRLRRHGWGGSGEVRWQDPNNRGFLRALHLLMVCAAALGETAEKARCRQFLLDLDPADGLGVGSRPELTDRELVTPEQLP
ncbi:MAG: DUF3151 family protein [Candidatus Dormiibacterota bacterium]